MRSVIVYLAVALGLIACSFIGSDMHLWSWPRWLRVPSLIFMAGAQYLILTLLVATALALFFSVRAVIRYKDRRALYVDASRAMISLVYIPLFIVALGAYSVRKEAAFHRVAANGNELVDALSQFHHDFGRYPEALDVLVPQHITAIPNTGLIGYPTYHYRRGFNDFDEVDDSYELVVYCPSGILNFDRFIYWPPEQYPERIQSSLVVPMENWAYLSE